MQKYRINIKAEGTFAEIQETVFALMGKLKQNKATKKFLRSTVGEMEVNPVDQEKKPLHN